MQIQRKKKTRELVRFVHEQNVWGGIERPPDFTEFYVYVTLFKYIRNVGYGILQEALKDSLPSHSSLSRYAQRILHALGHWATTTQLAVGTHSEWQAASALQAGNSSNSDRLRRWYQHHNQVLLWWRSLEFRLAKTREKSGAQYHPSWSLKAKGPAERFMVLMDANTVVRAVFGGYSPQTTDGEVIKWKKKWIDKKLGVTSVGNNRSFLKGAKRLKNHRLIVVNSLEKREAREEGNEAEEDEEGDGTEEEEKKTMQEMKMKMEAPFVFARRGFAALSVPFQEREEYLHSLVCFSLAVHNWKVQQQ
ncbi:hypothetical protein QOT17_017306 [Balamuthia mandrillaris]